MQHIDVAALVKSALEHIGCDSSLIGDLDAHSPIELTFNGSPNIYVDPTRDGIWLLSHISQSSEEEIRVRSEALLMSATMPREWVDGHFVAVGREGDDLVVKGRVHADACESKEAFAEAVADFYELVVETAETMRQ